MGQEFIIKSPNLEDKINQLLPSQGGFAAGVDLSASTTVIPIVDLTETAEGSNLRQDLQRAWTINTIRVAKQGSSGLVTNTTGYFNLNIVGILNIEGSEEVSCTITDGVTTTTIWNCQGSNTGGTDYVQVYWEGVIKSNAGDSINVAGSGNATVLCSARQIADLSGNLVNP